MSYYKRLILLGGILMSFFGSFIIVSGMGEGVLLWVLLPGGFLCLWWIGYYLLTKGSITLSLVLTSLMWFYVISDLIRMGQLVVQYKGFERPDGEGSPLAFLLGLVFEVFWYLYLSLVGLLAYRILRESRHEARSALDNDSGPVQTP